MSFFISLKLLQDSQASIPWGMLHGLLNHSAVFIVVPANRPLVPGVFISGTLDILYWQMKAQLVSAPLGPM